MTSESMGSGGSGDRLVDTGNIMINKGNPTVKETAVCVVFAFVGNALTLVMLIFMSPRQRPMPYYYLEGADEYIKRLSNDEILDGETVSTVNLFLMAVFGPATLQLILNKTIGRNSDVFRTICAYCVAVTLCNLCTEVIKNYVGYLRPVFFQECKPNEIYDSCTGAEGFAEDELRKSFVSGHASAAFCGCTLFTLFLERTFGISSTEIINSHERNLEVSANYSGAVEQNNQNQYPLYVISFRKDPWLHRVGSVFSLLPMCLAVYIASSRVVDNKHFPADVVGGAVLGASIAIYCHAVWFHQPRYMPI